MQYYWIKQTPKGSNTATTLIVFALGWAGHPKQVSHLFPSTADILCLYNYQNITPLDAAQLSQYTTIHWIAWSFGVWVTEQIAQNIPLTTLIACNGTPYPVDSKWGIPPRLVKITIRGVAAAGAGQFFQNTFGEQSGEKRNYSDEVTERDAQELSEELQYLYQRALNTKHASLNWNFAYVSKRDAIIPPENMIAYWENKTTTPLILLDAPHYPFQNEKLAQDLSLLFSTSHES